MSRLWTPGGHRRPEPQDPDDLPVVESTLTLACGHTTVTTDRSALRGAEAIHQKRVEARALCPNQLCLTDRLIVKVESKQQAPDPGQPDFDRERDLYEWEKKHGYRNPATGRRRPEYLGRKFQ